MDSWREEAPQAVQEDLDGLVETALGAAEGMLQANGEFFPFALAVDHEGGIQIVSGDPGLGEQPESQAVLNHLYGAVRGSDGHFRAAAFVADVSGTDSDAVRVEVEHRDGGPALAVYLPYQTPVPGQVTRGDLLAGESRRRIWQLSDSPHGS